MELFTVVIFIGVLLFMGFFIVGYLLLFRRVNLKKRLELKPKKQRSKTQNALSWDDYLAELQRILRPLGEMLPRSPKEMSKQRQRLVEAGIRRTDGPPIYYGIQILSFAFFLLLSILTGQFAPHPFLCTIVSVFLGAAVPDALLSWKISRRKEDIQCGLPDALDLLVVCVEAGLGLDQSLKRIGEEMHDTYSALSDELYRYGLELNAGQTRAQALRNLADRVNLEDLRSLSAVLIQTDRFGTSVADSLRVFADGLRTKRMQRAEERAAKMAVKMVFPLMLFIFPTIFVVVAGPAIIAIANDFVKALSAP